MSLVDLIWAKSPWKLCHTVASIRFKFLKIVISVKKIFWAQKIHNLVMTNCLIVTLLNFYKIFEIIFNDSYCLLGCKHAFILLCRFFQPTHHSTLYDCDIKGPSLGTKMGRLESKMRVGSTGSFKNPWGDSGMPFSTPELIFTNVILM